MALSAVVFSVLALFLVLFHSLLLFGAPLGYLTQGGFSAGKLPLGKRIAAFIQILILIGMVLIVLAKSKMAFAELHVLSHSLIWLVLAVSLLSLILNLITPSKKERLMGVPIMLLMVMTSFIVAQS